MRRKVRFGVYEHRIRPERKVTITHVGVLLNRRATSESEESVMYHTFNEPNYISQVMTVRDFLATYRFSGKLFSIYRVEEKIR